MAENSKIEWCDHTFNPWRGCQKVSAGCKNCYAENRADRFHEDFSKQRIVLSDAGWKQPLKWNREAEKSGVRAKVFCASLADVFEDWQGPMSDSQGRDLWVHNCEPHPEPNRYVAMPHDGISGLPDCDKENIYSGMFCELEMSHVRQRLFALIDATPNLDWLLVTKRPENIRKFWPTLDYAGICPKCRQRVEFNMPNGMLGGLCCGERISGGGQGPANHYRANCWLLSSVENQEQADKRIPELLKCRDLSPVLGLSCEPLLGPVDVFGVWGNYIRSPEGNCTHTLDWVISGGESGPNARLMHPDWARSLRDQCDAAGAAFFFKQWGEWIPYERSQPPLFDSQNGDSIDGHYLPVLTDHEPINGWWWPHIDSDAIYRKVGKKAAGRLLDGREWSQFPERRLVEG